MSYPKKGRPWRRPFFSLLLLISAAARVDADTECRGPTLDASQRFRVSPLETGLPTVGQWRDGYDLADMNADGRLDLVHGPPRKSHGRPVIFLGDGAGRFTLWSTAHFPPLPYDYGDLKAADVNGDGMMDVALAAHLRGLTVLINEGRGSFAPWAAGLRLETQERAPEGIFSSRSIALTDWNGDGKPDLLALNEGPARLAEKPRASDSLALYLNRGGYWQETEPTQSLRIFGSSLAVGDVDADGHPDAILGTEASGARLLVGLGQGESWAPRELRSLPPRAAVTAVAAHDFDRDGKDEILFGSRFAEDDGYCTELDLVHWSEAHEARVHLWSERSRDPVTTIVAADFDRDGRDDILAARQSGALLFFAAGPQGYTRDVTIPHPDWLSGCHAYQARAADLDGDARLELILSFAGERTTSGEQCLSGGGFAVWRVEAAPDRAD